MKSEDALARLEVHHVRIQSLLADVIVILGSGRPNTDDLAHLRWKMLRVLREYQLFKHTEIFDPLLSSVVGARREHAAALKARCLAMAANYARHVERWTLAGLDEASVDYLADTRAIAAQLSKFLPDERVGIQGLLEGVAYIRAA